MSSGWVLIWREIFEDSMWLAEPFTRGQAWVDLILLANHKPAMFYVRGNPVHVERGQVARAERTLAERWSWSRGKVRRFLSMLETGQQIVQQKNNVMGLITITNYNRYQPVDGKVVPQTVPQTDHRKTADSTNTKNVKEELKNDKEKEPPKLTLTETQLELIELLRSRMVENNSSVKISDGYINTWGKDLEKMMRLDGRLAPEIEEVILWCQADDFWCSNIMGFSKLRKQFDKLKLQMKRKGGSRGYQDPNKHKNGW